MIVLGGGVFGRRLGHEGGALRMGLVPIQKWLGKAPLPLPPCKDTGRITNYEPENSPDTGSASTMTLASQPPEQLKIRLLEGVLPRHTLCYPETQTIAAQDS